MTGKVHGHFYRNLPAYGFWGAALLIIIAVLIFNQLWTGLGQNPKTQLFPQITKDYEEFKDHATLIIALIAAIGSILSSLLIILFYDAWKDQHNKAIDSKYYSQALDSFKNTSTSIAKLKTLHDEYCTIEENHEPDIECFQNKFKNIKSETLQNLGLFQNDLIFLQNLNHDDDTVSKLESIYTNYISLSKSSFSQEKISFDFYNSYTDHEKFKTDLFSISIFQGELIKNNIKEIVKFLDSKIKA